ncbi:MAG: type II toxin-antitoxin system Phd/YefM family antitoxin [bacterium]|nr:type II toxin-antitoxin system Phd/YefM family antitoxin [bacterium]
MVTINASEFKAKCLAILDEVADTGEEVLILKRGRPVAQLVPPIQSSSPHPQDELRDSVVIKGDVIEPVLPAEAWEAVGGTSD